VSLKFRGNHMVADLKILSRITKGFLENASQTRLELLATRLESKIAEATRTPRLEFVWSTTDPIRTIPSKCYRGRRTDLSPLRVEITFEWKCFLDDAATTTVRVNEGASILTIVNEPNDERRKVLHFDVCQGGDTLGSGHPPLHLQVYGFINDVPRVPCYLVNPVDVIDFALLEFFQHTWHLSEARTLTNLRELPRRQKDRFLKTLARWRETVEEPDARHTFIALRRQSRMPLELL
jgi:hypothetical protein